MNINELRALVELPSILRDDTIVVEFPADEEYRYPVYFNIKLGEDNEYINFFAFSRLSVARERTSDAIIFCNDYNKTYVMPKVYFDMEDKDFNAIWRVHITEDISDDFVRLSVDRFLATAWRFFVRAGQIF